MLAASTASALPCWTPSARCCRLPTPPLAITGMPPPRQRAASVRGRNRSWCRRDPCWSAGSRRRRAASTSLRPLDGIEPAFLRPPWVNTSHLPGLVCLASMATTMHCEPTLAEASATSCGLFTAAVFMLTLSAPALSRRRTSSTLRTPPPTVSGMNTCSAQASTMCRMMSRSSELAVMSRKVISSAPCSS